MVSILNGIDPSGKTYTVSKIRDHRHTGKAGLDPWGGPMGWARGLGPWTGPMGLGSRSRPE